MIFAAKDIGAFKLMSVIFLLILSVIIVQQKEAYIEADKKI